MTEMELLNACCYKLIGAMRETNAETMTLKQEGVTFKGENIGDYEVTVRKLTPHTEEKE